MSLSAMSFLFSALVQQIQKSVTGIPDLERKLSDHGYRIGQRCLELYVYRDLKHKKRQTRLLEILQWTYTTLWKNLFGKSADTLEKSREANDEYMLIDNDPSINKFISIPKEMQALNCAAFVAGIIEGCMDGALFPCKVTAHSVATDATPNRTVFLIKLDASVLEREEYLE